MTSQPPALLTQAPDHLLAHRRAAQLETWCVEHGIRPSLLHIENERARRARQEGTPR